MNWGRAFLASLLLLVICTISGCEKKSYDDGVRDGRSQGYDEGHKKGYQEGLEAGRSNSYAQTHDSAYAGGYSQGFADASEGRPNKINDTRSAIERLGYVNTIILVLLDVMWAITTVIFFSSLSQELKGSADSTYFLLLSTPVGLAGLIFYGVFIVLKVRIIDAIADLPNATNYVIALGTAILFGVIIRMSYKLFQIKLNIIGQIISLTTLALLTLVFIQLTWHALQLAGARLNADNFSIIVDCAGIGSTIAIMSIGASRYIQNKGRRLENQTPSRD